MLSRLCCHLPEDWSPHSLVLLAAGCSQMRPSVGTALEWKRVISPRSPTRDIHIKWLVNLDIKTWPACFNAINSAKPSQIQSSLWERLSAFFWLPNFTFFIHCRYWADLESRAILEKPYFLLLTCQSFLGVLQCFEEGWILDLCRFVQQRQGPDWEEVGF